MDIKDLNKSQLLLLALLVSFITSVATGITVVALMDQAPTSISTPINRVVRQTVEKIVPIEKPVEALNEEEKKILAEVKSIQNLSVSIYKKGEKENTLLGSGLLLGENKIIINSIIPAPKEDEEYIARGIMGEASVTKVTNGEGYTLVEIAKDINNKQESNATTQ